ncbi:MAG: ParM/StbA family protein [Lachnospiraceae bacterium]|nr:ParM/StbA family protein [Lachnospiraceae bacterium]
MAKRFIAVDPGKFSTKVAEYDLKKDGIKKFQIRTKASPGDFRDDAIEANTVIAEIDGNCYKIGNGARGEGASLDTNKMSEIHKICALTALAASASSNEVDDFYVAVGLPAKDWANVSKRMDYKEYILPVGEITVPFKKNSTSPVQDKKFNIKKVFVYPESIGALFADETIFDISPTSITGVLDIGNLNLNATLWQGTEFIEDKSSTAELGGAILIQELSQEISSNICSCDELITANILKLPPNDRHLPDNLNLDSDKVEQSRALIKKVLKDHAEKIKRCCRARNWSLDVTKIVAIGGTSKDIEDELKEVFGNIVTLTDPTFCNAFGYLRMMCSQIPEISKVISLTDVSAMKNQESKAS